MLLVFAVLASLVFGDEYKPDPSGFHIRGWKFGRCASEQWTDYVVNITNITISPDKPQFPGPIFFHVTMNVKEDLSLDDVEMDLEVRKKAVSVRDGRQRWEVIPCRGWDILDGCNGYGSCRYCNVLEQCNQAVVGAFQYVNDRKIFKNTMNQHRIQNNNLCPPPKGKWTMTFSREFSAEDLPNSIFSFLYSNEYWLMFNFYDGKLKTLGCARLWIDMCRYSLKDKNQKCIKEQRNTGFVSEIFSQEFNIRNRNSH